MFVGRSDGDLGSDWEVIKPWTQQGKERENLLSLFESWTKVTGIREDEVKVSSDGEVFTLSNPGPVKCSDFTHVALVSTAGGTRFSDEPSPLASTDKSIEATVDVYGQAKSFPYLQLNPPHCDSCQCQ